MFDRIEIINKGHYKRIFIQNKGKEIVLEDTDIQSQENGAVIIEDDIITKVNEILSKRQSKIMINADLSDKEKSKTIRDLNSSENKKQLKKIVKKSLKRKLKKELGKNNFNELFDDISKYVSKKVKKYHTIEAK